MTFPTGTSGRGRERFWGKGMDGTKEAAFATLYTVLTTLAKVIAPFVPFIAEDIYQNLVRSVDQSAPESIHLSRFPQADETLIDENLNAQMDALLDIVSLGRACRNASALKVRQPLKAMYVKGAKLDGEFVSLLEDELNVKAVEFHRRRPRFYHLQPETADAHPRSQVRKAAGQNRRGAQRSRRQPCGGRFQPRRDRDL